MPIRFAAAGPVLLALLPLPAAAHPGHLAEAAGHAHWLGAAALGAALAIAAWQLLRGVKAKSEEDKAQAEGEEAEEASDDAEAEGELQKA
ncbi:hypothetical protein KM176_12745 [Pseudooceanicola sp. CBS1P-1]|uniref:Uncharacterized protein n=1 Tax=Pseudooceanicola albus TaxID=2692189 RepID=A0A6L7G4X8_9RHOB|nr:MULTISPECIES: DUF6732 family protein [Pseudooceanicola]MBT9384729.1 hypothetical protein [Pseudooceanicola endophyticus]MXN18430.1 hypothetical protein [Pseudooceanicola albus]